MERRDFIKQLLGGASLLALDIGSLPVIASAASGHRTSVVILGIDGMDPVLLQKFVNKGRMPTFQKLMAEGSFSPLRTSIPPQSPVAWSNFITGMDPGTHGIFDFIHRDPQHYLPTFSLSRVDEPSHTINIGDWTIPVSGGGTRLLRQGKAFWQTLDEYDVPYTIFRIPSNFPPVECNGRSISGLGTPDILGTYGTFSYYTDDPDFAGLDVSGGRIFSVSPFDGRMTSSLFGPENSMKKDRSELESPLAVCIDQENQAAKIMLGDNELLLKVGEWSPWVEVSFKLLGPLKTLKGICRFYLKSLDPYFGLYASPVNIDPAHPALPISTPPDYATRLYEKIGYFYTQGMAEDTKALEWGVLSDGEYIDQARMVLAERLKMLDVVLDDYRGGFLFFYISTLDLCQHMLWRNMDPDHPGHDEQSAEYQDQIEELYVEMDGIVADVQRRIPRDSTLMIMSDHGFSPFYRKFNLNSWLYENGYISLKDPARLEEATFFSNVWWRRTKAYGLGINGLYLNLQGREGHGIVAYGDESESILDELSTKLLSLRDAQTGQSVIKEVYRTSEVYHGAQAEHAPDLVIGYRRGYRCSDESALGLFTRSIFKDNMSKWSGDHCMAPEEIPGIVVANRKLQVADPDLMDFAATVLALFDIRDAAPASSRPLFDMTRI